MSSRIEAIVFDFDGVILESAQVKTEAFCALYEEHGADVVARVRAHHLANLGISRFKKFVWIAQNVLLRSISEPELAALGERFTQLALQRVLAAPFVRGAEEALITLAARYPLLIASGTPQSELDHIVEQRGIRHWFREVHGTPREKPEILADVLRRHELQPAQLLFIGDGLSDYDAASATKVSFLARDTPELHEEWVARAVQRRWDLTELPALVEAWA